MVSLFKAVRDNNEDALQYLIELTQGGTSASRSPSVSQHDQEYMQNYLRMTKQKRFNVNRRSSRGRTALHCAALWNCIPAAQLLINCDHVDVNCQDLESGWTPLHCALYTGHIYIATLLMQHRDIDLSIKDWNGYLATELFLSTLPSDSVTDTDRSELEDSSNLFDQDVGKVATLPMTELYTWGPNTNYTIAHTNAEGYSYPHRVQLHDTRLKGPIGILYVSMAKYHTAVITNSPTYNLYLCGYGVGGRLGSGTSHTHLALAPASIKSRVVAVALGQDHTVALTKRGHILTFGNNSHGQLGYPMDEPHHYQLEPRRVQVPFQKNERMVGVAASKWHSVVYTQTSLFTFGYNHGQLGYHPSVGDARQLTPRKVNLSVPILQVVATGLATAILLQNSGVIVFVNYDQRFLKIPNRRLPDGIRCRFEWKDKVVRLFSGDEDQIGAVTHAGDVYLWTFDIDQASVPHAYLKPTVYISGPKRVWTSTRPDLVAVEADTGRRGAIIVRTIAGLAYIVKGHIVFSFQLITQLDHCVRVCANPCGDFAVIRSEQLQVVHTNDPEMLTFDLLSSLPHVKAEKDLNTQLDALQEQYHDWLSIDAKRAGLETAKIESHYKNQRRDLIALAWDKIHKMAVEDPLLDVKLETPDTILYCHSTVLHVRCPTLLAMDKDCEGNHDPFTRVKLPACLSASLLLFLNFIYSGTIQRSGSRLVLSPALCDREVDLNIVCTELLSLADRYQLPSLRAMVLSEFKKAFKRLVVEDMNRLDSEDGKVELLLANNERLFSHTLILVARCPFFNFMLDSRYAWASHCRTRQNTLRINMKHISKQVMSVVLQYLYTGHRVENLVEKELDVDEKMELFIQVMVTADELLLHTLKQQCERELMTMLSIHNVIPLVSQASVFDATYLVDACLEYIQFRLMTLLTTRKLGLDHLDPSIIYALEKVVQTNQDKFLHRIPFQSCATADDTHDEFLVSFDILSRQETASHLPPTYFERWETRQTRSRIDRRPSKTTIEIPPVEAAITTHDPNPTLYDATLPTHARWAETSAEYLSTLPYAKDTVKSLKDILAEEEQASRRQSSSVHIPIKKLSQKQRKKLEHEEQLATITAKALREKEGVWGKIASSPPKSSAFTKATPSSSLSPPMASEIEYSDDVNHASSSHPLSRPDSLTVTNLKTHYGPQFQLVPIGHHSTIGMRLQSGTDRERPSFQRIQWEQEQELTIRQKQSKKSLMQIQAEERAIMALQAYYVQTIEVSSGVWVEIEPATTP